MLKYVTALYRRVAHRGDERGAIMIMAIAGVIVMVMSASLSIDIGRIALEKRSDQSIADLAALDAARDRNNAQALAVASAARNGFKLPPDGPNHTLTTEVGSLDSHGAFVPNVGSTAVRVTVSSLVDYLFQVGHRTLYASAVAAMRDFGSFSIGSNLASISSDQATLLNGFVGRMIGNPAPLSFTAVGWQGLLTGNFTLQALQTQLVSGGLDVGTLDKLMSTNLTLAQIYTAEATVLTNQGQVANASIFSAMATAAAAGTTHMKLGDLFTVNQGDPNTILTTSMNLFDFATGTAEVANGSNFVTVPNVGVAVPQVGNTSVSLQVIEGPKYCLGCAVGEQRQTAQVRMTVTPTLNLLPAITGLVNPNITGDLPLTVVGGAATGTLKTVSCLGAGTETVTVDLQPVALDSTGLLHVSSKILFAQVPLLDMSVTGSLTVNGSSGDLTFSPPSGTKHYGSNIVGLQSLPYTTGTVTLLGALPIPQATITSGVVAALGPAQGSVDSKVVTPLMNALGLQVGSADVTAIPPLKCNVLGLVG